MISKQIELSPEQKEKLDALISKDDLLNNDKKSDEDVEKNLKDVLETFKQENIYSNEDSSQFVFKTS